MRIIRPMPDSALPPSDPAFERAKSLFLDGLARFEAGAYDEAERCYVESLRAWPGRTSTLVNLAATQRALGRPSNALITAQQVLQQEPDSVDAWLHRTMALLALQRHDEALPALERLLQLSPAQPDLWCSRGDLLRERGRLDEAAHAYRQARLHGAEPELIDYFLAALQPHGQVTRALPQGTPRSYVQSLFDGYAGDFDHHLVEVLRYRAPQALIQPLQGRRFQQALDLGCGTGLCGPLMRPLAQKLVGVDLSSGMLDKARELKVYDELAQVDIVEHLRAAQTPYDLVVAADVFIYVGELTPVFAEVRRLMPAGGVFCFSAELPEEGAVAQGVQLLPSLRYTHAEPYLREIASACGFDVMRMARAPVREDQRQPVDGLFVHLVRRAT